MNIIKNILFIVCILISPSALSMKRQGEDYVQSNKRAKLYQCTYEGCDKNYTTKSNLTKHRRNHTQKNPFKCPHEGCDKSYTQKSSLDRHQKIHSSQKTHKCSHEGCDKSYTHKSSLEIHIQQKHSSETPYKCFHEGCDKSYPNKSSLEIHIQQKHSGETPYKCSYQDCDKSFATKYGLARHQKLHILEKTYKCSHEDCDKSFKEKNDLKRHQKTHIMEKAYKCSHEGCDKSFGLKCYLIKHQKTHTEKYFKCSHEDCDKSFKEKNDLKRHQKTHASERLYQCNYEGCNKSYPERCTLARHQKTHGEKCFKCPHEGCDESFAIKNYLTRHQKLHNDEKRFNCSHEGCAKFFLLKNQLERHQRTHIEKRFKCPHEGCNKSYTHNRSLKVHQLTKHQKIHEHELELENDDQSAPSIKVEPDETAVYRVVLSPHLSEIKNKNFERLTEALKTIRGPHNEKNNCTHLSKAVLHYLSRGEVVEANTEPSKDEDYLAILEWGPRKVKTEDKSKSVIQIHSAGFVLESFENFSPTLPIYRDVRHSIDITHDDLVISEATKVLADNPIKEGTFYLRSGIINSEYQKLESELKSQAQGHSHGISYGFLTMGRAGAAGVLLPGHMITYFATPTWVIYIDLHMLDGEKGIGNPILWDLNEQFKFVDVAERTTRDTFGQYIFYAPMN
jgi:KRAB domain-containing zinc finger protein